MENTVAHQASSEAEKTSPTLTLHAPTYEAWREQAKQLLAKEISPEKVQWGFSKQVALFDDSVTTVIKTSSSFDVPEEFVRLAELVALHRSPDRWNKLYAILWRLRHHNKNLLGKETDPDVRAAQALANQVKRDIAKMKNFLRFTSQGVVGKEYCLAWYEPEHFILEGVARYFAEKLPSKNWSIYTPQGHAKWDQRELKIEWRRYTQADFISLDLNRSKWSELWKNHYSQLFASDGITRIYMKKSA